MAYNPGRSAAGEVRRAASEFERLTADAAELRQDVDFAKALRVGDPAQWQRVQPEAWQGILLRLEQWSEANLANPEVPLRETIAKQAQGSKDYPSLYGPLRLPLRAVVAWLRAGVVAADAEPMRILLAQPEPDSTAGRPTSPLYRRPGRRPAAAVLPPTSSRPCHCRTGARAYARCSL